MQYVPESLREQPEEELGQITMYWCANWKESLWIDDTCITENGSGRVGAHKTDVYVKPGRHKVTRGFRHLGRGTFPLAMIKADGEEIAALRKFPDYFPDQTPRLRYGQGGSVAKSDKFSLYGPSYAIEIQGNKIHILERLHEATLDFEEPFRYCGGYLWETLPSYEVSLAPGEVLPLGEHMCGGYYYEGDFRCVPLP